MQTSEITPSSQLSAAKVRPGMSRDLPWAVPVASDCRYVSPPGECPVARWQSVDAGDVDWLKPFDTLCRISQILFSQWTSDATPLGYRWPDIAGWGMGYSDAVY